MKSEDDEEVRRVAGEMIEQHGKEAPEIALALEALCRVKGHDDDADIWLEIAQAAADMLRTP